MRSIPLVGPNPEHALFEDLEAFRFADGSCFDFRGVTTRSANGRDGTLANSNERAEKGFVVTWQADRTIGPVGKLKLDWIFVKAPLADPRDEDGPYRFAPHFGRTMHEVNYALEERLSDHNPISADLPLREAATPAPSAP